jgi:Leucine-rich repeat (LRR) protein
MFKTKFNSLDEAVKSPTWCRTLDLMFIKKSFKDSGLSLAKLKNLRKLHIQGDVSIYDDYEFSLPSEIGTLTKLTMLSLLNLPIKIFPDWIFDLVKLEYLMVRGTDIDVIPGEIFRLKQLQTLRVENCPLATIPPGLIELKKLKYLGVVDTKITTIDEKILPPKLRRISNNTA